MPLRVSLMSIIMMGGSRTSCLWLARVIRYLTWNENLKCLRYLKHTSCPFEWGTVWNRIGGHWYMMKLMFCHTSYQGHSKQRWRSWTLQWLTIRHIVIISRLYCVLEVFLDLCSIMWAGNAAFTTIDCKPEITHQVGGRTEKRWHTR